MPSTPLKSSLQPHRINTMICSSQKQQQSSRTSYLDRVHDHLTAARATPIPETVGRYHAHEVGSNQCCSAVIQVIDAPVSTVWSVVRRFDNPQAYKSFIKSCNVIRGNGCQVGCVREVRVVSGLPAATSTERLEILDDERHILSFSMVGGDHRLSNYRSVTTLHPSSNNNGSTGTVVVESYVVDVPIGNTKDDTCVFVDTIVKCNLQSLASFTENLVVRNCSSAASSVHHK
ncbi:hypothetical protein MKW94_009079 [Papaver nudicaule]|uniref:Abscisic acid receptor PYL4 n=1 Tax=Papaver nudicaule TaxID=74823 RepID=A0AA41SAC5_PAPNU|nr:hypothetical protein [Papaver nudicaule]